MSPGMACHTAHRCTVYPLLPFLAVLTATSTATGDADIPLPIPCDTALSGALVHAQGGVLDPSGALLGVAALTPGLRILIGD